MVLIIKPIHGVVGGVLSFEFAPSRGVIHFLSLLQAQKNVASSDMLEALQVRHWWMQPILIYCNTSWLFSHVHYTYTYIENKWCYECIESLYTQIMWYIYIHGKIYSQCSSEIVSPKTCIDVKEIFLKRSLEETEQWRLFKEKLIENKIEANTIIGKLIE